MKVINPVTITDATLVSHSVPETDYAVYAGATTYALGDRVIKSHLVYESLQAANVGHDPASTASSAWWLQVGSTNRWRMFDSTVNSSTTATSSITFDVVPGAINAVGLIELVGSTVQVQVLDGATVVYDVTKAIDTTTILSWEDYFFEPFDPAASLFFADVPQYVSGTVRVTIVGASTVSCGGVIFGRATDLGGTEFGASVGIVDYSTKSTNIFGVTSVVRRAFSKRASVKLQVPTNTLRRVQGLLADLRSTPCLWIGDDDTATYAPLVIFGYYRDFTVEIQYPQVCACSLEIEGMI
jgi:hypothetical protein